jgi:hypothetical protein
MSFVSIKASTSFLKSFLLFATIAFNVVIELEQFELEPCSKLKFISCKANGEVLFLSVLSKRTSGILPTTFNFKSVFFWR